MQLRAERGGDGFRLSGRKLFVPYAQVADPLLVLARTGAAPEALSLFLVPGRAAGLTLNPLVTLSGERQYEVEFDDVALPEDALVGQLRRRLGRLPGRLPTGDRAAVGRAGGPGRHGA